MHPNAIS